MLGAEHASIWTHRDPVRWRIYASHCPNEFETIKITPKNNEGIRVINIVHAGDMAQ